MQVFLENDRLIFQPDSASDRADLVNWWAQLQSAEGAKPNISTATVEKALIVFIPQR